MSDLSIPRGSAQEGKHVGVRGWLLVLCLILTVVAPLIVACLVANQYTAIASDPAQTFGQFAAALVSMLLMVCSAGYGIYAGIRLWQIRPNAVGTAKNALLLGLAVDIVTTTLSSTAGPAAFADGQFRTQILFPLLPSLIFFTLCYAYLNKSRRVLATYQDSGAV